MAERRGTKALELWCRRITDGYPGVNVQNMTTSWRDGLAFCAMIHHFRPDLIDFDSLNKDDVYGNNELAFRTAEQHLGIPALLDAEDMASCTVPDRLSILTYLSQFYQTFGGSSPSRLALSRTTETADERIAPVSESPKQPKVVESRLGMRRDSCAACGLPVFLAEKLLVDRTPYHRTCFRCARCTNQLTPGNYYETEAGQYCCETCPDEERRAPLSPLSPLPLPAHGNYEDTTRFSTDLSAAVPATGGGDGGGGGGSSSDCCPARSLSDEEKTERKTFEVEEISRDRIPDLISQTSQMRLSFMASQMLSERSIANEVDERESDRNNGERWERSETIDGKELPRDSAYPDGDEDENEDENEDDEENSSDVGHKENEEEEYSFSSQAPRSPDLIDPPCKSTAKMSRNGDLGLPKSASAVSDNSVERSVGRMDDTKELSTRGADEDECLSLVQKRLRIFEGQERSERRFERQDHRAAPPAAKRIDLSTIRAEVDVDIKLERDRVRDHDRASAETPSPPDTSKLLETTIEGSEGVLDRLDSTREPAESRTRNCCNKLPVEFQDTTIPSKRSEDRGERPSVLDSANENSLLTAKGVDLSGNEDYPEDLNPFKSDEDERDTKSGIARTNPFGSSDDEDIAVPPKPTTRINIAASKGKDSSKDAPMKRRLAAPHINFNPFWSDDDNDDNDDDDDDDDYGGGRESFAGIENNKERKTTAANVPIPKPRTIKSTLAVETGTMPRQSLDRGGLYASNSSITSSESAATTPGGTYRKKKPAPPPPPASKELFLPEQRTTPTLDESSSSSASSAGRRRQKQEQQGALSSKTTPRIRKTKPAPPPPFVTSTPRGAKTPEAAPFAFTESVVKELDMNDSSRESNVCWVDQKLSKDETNRNRQSLTGILCDAQYKSYTDKSVQGKWKRKKGPAPLRPTPPRRKIKVMSMKDVKLELDEIEMQQQGLEKQGVRLEQLIRDKCESGSQIDGTSLGIDVEELVLELFALVNEKNELFRRQAELMLLRRQQRLEEEHAEVEYQIRCLMCQPEATKTDFDKQREEALIQRLIEIVERRNEIVDCLEMDRRREVEEDRSIHKHMGLFAARNKGDASENSNDSCRFSKTKKGKLKEKMKEKRSKKFLKKDADKDVDETEVKLKRHTKRKWF